MQESGGRGLDPMQAAEGSFNTRYPHEPNGIKDPEYSIECGVQAVSYTHLDVYKRQHSDSSFFLSLPAAWRWVCIFFSVHGLERKPSVGFVS